jgi:hypothetical protein
MNTQADTFRQFGRFSDLERNIRQKKHWKAAMEAFTQDQSREAIGNLLNYLRNPDTENIHVQNEGPISRFELFQGSGKITGFADAMVFKAIAPVGRIKQPHVGFMRRLLEKNYYFQHCRYTIDPENLISLVFDTPMSLASPYQVYQGLREIALAADQDDDLLTDEFTEIQFLRQGGTPIPEGVAKQKVACLRHHIKSLLHELEYGGKAIQRNPGTLSYLILDLVYKIDYLLLPQGFTMRSIDTVHKIFFQQEELTLERKVDGMLKELRKILDRTDEQLMSEYYHIRHTFGLAQEATPELISTFIRSELPAMNWYMSNNQDRAASSVVGFIVGYLLYQFSLPSPIRYLLHLVYEVLQDDLFTSLCNDKESETTSGWNLNQGITEKLGYVKNIDADVYPDWNFSAEKVLKEDRLSFARSLLEAISQAQLPKSGL